MLSQTLYTQAVISRGTEQKTNTIHDFNDDDAPMCIIQCTLWIKQRNKWTLGHEQKVKDRKEGVLI